MCNEKVKLFILQSSTIKDIFRHFQNLLPKHLKLKYACLKNLLIIHEKNGRFMEAVECGTQVTVAQYFYLCMRAQCYDQFMFLHTCLVYKEFYCTCLNNFLPLFIFQTNLTLWLENIQILQWRSFKAFYDLQKLQALIESVVQPS